MNEFKVGDKVRVKPGGSSLYKNMVEGDVGVVAGAEVVHGRIVVKDENGDGRRIRPDFLEKVDENPLKVGDKVRMKEGRSSKYGHIKGGDICYVTETTVRDGHIRVSTERTLAASRLVRPEDLESAAPDPTEDEPVNIAGIQELADTLGLCSDFDDLMASKYGWPRRNMVRPTMGEMRELAHAKGYGTYFDGTFPKPEEPHIGYPEVGRWVKATMENGDVREFEVTKNDDRTTDYILTDFTYGDSGRTAYFIIPKGVVARGDHPECRVVAWEYIEKPWKVGDEVPAGTAIDKAWTGEYKGNPIGWSKFRTYLAGVASSTPRTIVWIQD